MEQLSNFQEELERTKSPNKQYVIIVEERMLDAFAMIFPYLKALEVQGVNLKDEHGNVFAGLVCPMPKPKKQSKEETENAPEPVTDSAVNS